MEPPRYITSSDAPASPYEREWAVLRVRGARRRALNFEDAREAHVTEPPAVLRGGSGH